MNRIQRRTVLNDAVVGVWEVFNEYPKSYPQTFDDFAKWLKDNGYNEEFGGGGFGSVHNYGLRCQFRIPLDWIPVEIPSLVVCIEDTGVSLSIGKSYVVFGMEEDMITLIDDDGRETKFMSDRFKF